MQVIRALPMNRLYERRADLGEGSHSDAKVEPKVSTSSIIIPVKSFFACSIFALNYRVLAYFMVFYSV